MELVISKIVPAQIESNINQLEQFMLEVKEKYTGLVYTEDTIKTAKEQRAVLNKLEKGIAEVRRKAEKDSKIEIEEFIGKLKEAEKEIKLLSGDIDVQVKTFEEKERKNKYIEINELIDSKFINHEDLKDFLNVSTKWTNKTYSRNMIEEELELQFKELVKKKEFIADKLKEVNEILITTLLFKEFKCFNPYSPGFSIYFSNSQDVRHQVEAASILIHLDFLSILFLFFVLLPIV